MTLAKQRFVEGRIRDAIEGLRPLIPTHAEVIALVRFEAETGVVVLRLDGDCPDCDMPVAALVQGIEAHLKMRIREIRAVRIE